MWHGVTNYIEVTWGWKFGGDTGEDNICSWCHVTCSVISCIFIGPFFLHFWTLFSWLLMPSTDWILTILVLFWSFGCTGCECKEYGVQECGFLLEALKCIVEDVIYKVQSARCARMYIFLLETLKLTFKCLSLYSYGVTLSSRITFWSFSSCLSLFLSLSFLVWLQ